MLSETPPTTTTKTECVPTTNHKEKVSLDNAAKRKKPPSEAKYVEQKVSRTHIQF